MVILKNQIIFQCEYCGKRLLSKKGAKIHENKYCKNENSPNRKNCKHENTHTQYIIPPGETMQVPDYEICLDCGWIN